MYLLMRFLVGGWRDVVRLPSRRTAVVFAAVGGAFAACCCCCCCWYCGYCCKCCLVRYCVVSVPCARPVPALGARGRSVVGANGLVGISLQALRVVSNDQTKFRKTCYFGKKKMSTLSKRTTKLSVAKHCAFGKFLEILGNFLIITPSYFIQTSHSSRREPTARRRSLWSKCWRGKDSRHSPCTSEVGSPSSPAQIAWENLGRLLFDYASAPAQNDAHVASTQASRPVSPALS